MQLKPNLSNTSAFQVAWLVLPIGLLLLVSAAAANPEAGDMTGFQGTVLDASNSTGLGDVLVFVVQHSDNSFVDFAETTADGSYQVELAAGSYLAVTNAFSQGDPLQEPTYQYLIDVYNDGQICIGGVRCLGDNASVAPIVVSEGNMTTVDFELPRGGNWTGRITELTTGATFGNPNLFVFDSSGNLLGSPNQRTELDGRYLTSGIPAGQYYLVSAPGGVVPQAFGGGECPSIDPCPFDDATLLTVIPEATEAADFAFELQGGYGAISGSFSPMVGRTTAFGVSMYDETGAYVGPGARTGSTPYIRPLLPGQYFVKGWSGGAAGSVVFDGISCPEPCDATVGTLVNVVEGAITSGVDFSLLTATIFADDFESGDTFQWSNAIP